MKREEVLDILEDLAPESSSILERMATKRTIGLGHMPSYLKGFDAIAEALEQGAHGFHFPTIAVLGSNDGLIAVLAKNIMASTVYGLEIHPYLFALSKRMVLLSDERGLDTDITLLNRNYLDRTAYPLQEIEVFYTFQFPSAFENLLVFLSRQAKTGARIITPFDYKAPAIEGYNGMLPEKKIFLQSKTTSGISVLEFY